MLTSDKIFTCTVRLIRLVQVEEYQCHQRNSSFTTFPSSLVFTSPLSSGDVLIADLSESKCEAIASRLLFRFGEDTWRHIQHNAVRYAVHNFMLHCMHEAGGQRTCYDWQNYLHCILTESHTRSCHVLLQLTSSPPNRNLSLMADYKSVSDVLAELEKLAGTSNAYKVRP